MISTSCSCERLPGVAAGRQYAPAAPNPDRGASGVGAAASPQISLESAERQALLQVIELHHWKMSMVAEHLGISRNTLYRKIKRHGIPVARLSSCGTKLSG